MMMTKPTISEKYEALPESLKTEVDHYIEFLLEKYVNPTSSSAQDEKDENPENLEKSHGYGSLAGQIIMSDDFDEPLEDLKEYM
jgi:sugar-specific transcriptional regulator TrmB